LNIDSGIKALTLIAGHYGLKSDYNQIKYNYIFNNELISKVDLVRAAKELGLKSRLVKITPNHLKKMKLPAIVFLSDLNYVILTEIKDESIRYFNIHSMREEEKDIEIFLSSWDKKIILFTLREKLKSETKFGFKWFLNYIFYFQKSFREVMFSSFILQLLGLISPFIMQIIIDKVLVHRTYSTLWIIAFCLLLTMIFEWILGVGRMFIFSHMTSKIDVIFNSKLFSHLHSLPIKYFEDRKVGEITNRIRETEKIRSFLTGTPITTVMDIVFIFIYLIIMFFYSIKLSVVTLVFLPMFIILSLVITPIFKERLKLKFDRNAEVTGYMIESISGIQTLKGLGVEGNFEKKWENKLANYIESNYKTKYLGNIANSTAELIQSLLNLFIIWLGTKEVLAGRISVGAFIAFRMYSSQIIMPIIRTIQLWQTFQQTAVAVNNLEDIFNEKPENDTEETKTVLPNIRGDIEFKNVFFRYDFEGKNILKDISFKIKEGQSLGIVGRSGSGKSTISKLLQRLYKINDGKITIDSMDISLVDSAWIRRQIGVVLQENYLFSGTIKENIDIGNVGHSDEAIIRAASLSGAHDFIKDLPDGYDTIVGEKGSLLSGGQRQRIAIARALVNNPKILIFDEATSALDYESENIIQKNMKDIIKGRTVIIIAHRISTLRDVDYILSLDKGQLVEFDKKENLANTKGLYSYMCSQQMG